MKLTSIEIQPDNSPDVAVLSFRDPGSVNPYNVRGITGLDADTIVPKHYKGSGSANYFQMAMQPRTVVFSIALNPDFALNKTFSELRDDLYKMISSSRTGKVTIRFKNTWVVVAKLSGYISKIESPNFEKTQEVTVTVFCDDPMLSAENATYVVDNLNGPLTSELLFSDNVSTAPHGIGFVIEVVTPITTLTLIDPVGPGWSFKVTYPGGFLVGDRLLLSSETNNKQIKINRATVDYVSIVDQLYPGSVWPLVFPGSNRLAWDPLTVKWISVWHTPTYWGV